MDQFEGEELDGGHENVSQEQYEQLPIHGRGAEKADDSDLSDLEEQEIPQHTVTTYDQDDYDEEYESEDLDGTGKRRKAKRRAGAKKARSNMKIRGPRDAGRDLPSHLNAESAAKVLEVRKTFDEALKSISNTRRRKRDLDVQEVERLAINLRDKMKEAADLDVEAHGKKELALHKLKMLPIVQRELDRPDVQEIFLDHHILEAFHSWLEPLPDAALPLHDIRKSLFQLLVKFPIATDHLRECRIGPLIMFYSKCPRETSEIKKIAQECITKWSRPILNISDSYRDVRLQEREVSLSQVQSQIVLPTTHVRTMPDNSRSSNTRTDSFKALRARIPLPTSAGYQVRPSNNVMAAEAKRKRGDVRPIDKTLAKLKTSRR